MHKMFLLSGAMLGAIAVAFGAFGAHGLKQLAPAETIQFFQTGVQYQMYHAIALLVTGILYERFPNKFTKLAGSFFLIGILLFSGSLYLLAIFKATEIAGLSKIGVITPVGGLCFISGWLLLFAGMLKKTD